MIDRVHERFGIKPDKLVGDTGYGSAEMLGWLVEDRKIAPHIPVWDKSKRTDGTFSREDFAYDPAADSYTCPDGNTLQTYRRKFSKPRSTNVSKDGLIRYRACKQDCDACPLKPQCCPTQPAQKSAAVRARSRTRRRPRHPQNRRLHDLVHPATKGRDAVCPPQTIHRPANDAAPRTQRRNRTVPTRCNRSKPPQTGQVGASTSAGVRKAGARLDSDNPSKPQQTPTSSTVSGQSMGNRADQLMGQVLDRVAVYFCNLRRTRWITMLDWMCRCGRLLFA